MLFLAVAHTPAIFADKVREEFYMALELVRGFSKGSWVSKRLWKTIRVLKEVGPKLGVASREKEAERHASQQAKGELDPSRSAAVAMAGLAGHNVDEMALLHGNSQTWAGSTGSSSSPDALVNDLTSLFEAAGGYQTLGNGNVDGQDDIFNGGTNPEGMDNAANVFGGDEGLSNILKELI